MTNKKFGVILAASVALCPISAALAQETESQDQVAADEEQSGGYDVIVVTANKRAQSVADVGLSITAYGGEDVAEYGFEAPADIAAFTPGLSATNATGSGNPIFAIRGIGLDDFNANNTSGVGVYIDEVYAAYPVFLNGQLFDVDRVEVLKGPQGTLYGKNSTGGAINYIAVQPSDEFTTYAKLGYGRFNTFSAEGAIGGKLFEGVTTRLSGSATTGDGWQRDPATGQKFGSTDKFAVRSLTNIEIGDRADLLLNFHYSEDKSTPLSAQNETIDTLFGLPPGTVGVVSGNPREARAGNLVVRKREKGYGGSAKLVVDLDEAILTSITAYERYKRNIVDNADGNALATGDFTFVDDVEFFSQELRLTSNNDSVFSWILGANYSYDTVDSTNTIQLTDFIDGILNQVAMTPLGTVTSSRTRAVNRQVTKSLGIYLHTETEITDRLKMTAGIRYSHDRRRFNGINTDLDGWTAVLGQQSFVPIPGITTAQLNQARSEENISGKFALDYDITDDILVYASFSTSYKSGVFYGSPVPVQAALSYVGPEEVTAYEAGFKSAFLGNSLQLNGSVFQYDYDNRQSLVTAQIPFGGVFVTLINIPKSRIRGAELELRWMPVDGFDLRGGLGYLDGKVRSNVTTARGVPLLVPIQPGTVLSQAPKWSYSISGRYEHEFGDLLGSAQLAFSHTGRQFGTLADPQAVYGALNDLSGRLSLGSADETWQVSLWGKNLTNNKSSTYAFTTAEGGRNIYPQRPVEYGIELTLKY